jgi:hypothetical protein
MDIFHVAVPNFQGSDGAYHLLAMKLDTENIDVPEATEFAPGSPKYNLGNARSARRARSVGSASSRSRGSQTVQTIPCLSEMMLLFDSKTQHNVHLVHLSYKDPKVPKGECSSSQTQSNLDGCMPSLRDFVRPTDWGTVCGKIQNYTSHSDPTSEKSLGRLWIKMFEQQSSYLKACKAVLKPGGQSKYWLHLQNFRQYEKEQSVSDLGDITEARMEEVDELEEED